LYLIVSSSLNPVSRSRVMARAAAFYFRARGLEHRFLDLTDYQLPFCDNSACYEHPDSKTVAAAIEQAAGILIATPIYNYDVSASAKNLIEVTGKCWTEKVVGFLCAAGGSGSYMAPMGLANSLMLDYHTLVLPRFVYANADSFSGERISDLECERRIEALVEQMICLCGAVGGQRDKR
jgi:FMN reductase